MPGYVRNGEKYLLYSIGLDGKDDGGRLIENIHLRPAYVQLYPTIPQGDIVVGINIATPDIY